MREKKTKERRSMARVPLDIPYFVRLAVSGGGSHKVMLNDIGAGGLQLDLPSNQDLKCIVPGSRVEVLDFPPEIRRLNGISGTVIWVEHGCCGVKFEQELEDDGFLDLLDHL